MKCIPSGLPEALAPLQAVSVQKEGPSCLGHDSCNVSSSERPWSLWSPKPLWPVELGLYPGSSLPRCAYSQPAEAGPWAGRALGQ